MSKSLSPQTTWAVISAGVLLLMGWLSYFFYQQATNVVAGHTTVTQNYNVGVLQEASAPDKDNIYLKTQPLHDIPQSNPVNIQYSSTDLGKKDLSQFE